MKEEEGKLAKQADREELDEAVLCLLFLQKSG
jgi:hypothetical protein